MSPVIRKYYYSSLNKEQEKKLNRLEPGALFNGTLALYSDAELTKKVGTINLQSSLLDTSKTNSVYKVEATIVTSEGVIEYKYLRDSYEKVVLDTQETLGLFVKGTITRTYETLNKELRKIVYRANTDI